MQVAPDPSPLMGTLEYVLLAVPSPTPRSVTATILIEPSTALSLTAALSVEVAQSAGTGIKSVVSNFTISLGLILNRYFQIYPSPLVPAALGSRSVK